MPRHALLGLRALVTLVALVVTAPVVSAQPNAELEQEVRDALRRDRDLRRLEVGVDRGQVTLAGELDTFWEKSEAIRRALEVEGVDTVISEMTLPPPESDEDMVEDISRAVQRYPHYTLFDYIDGRIENGVVTLMGRVTADREKAKELFERVAKIRGIQEVQNQIVTLTPSTEDDRLRNNIARQVFNSPNFERFSSLPNPPFHIVVDRGVVTLLGYVQTQIEYQDLERIVRQMDGVLRVVNNLQAIS